MVRTHRVSLAVAAALALAACTSPPTDVSAWSTPGFAPLEAVTDAQWPPAGTVALGDVTRGAATGYNWAHGRGYVAAPLAKVYQALHDPEASRIRTSIDTWTPTVENGTGYPIHFEIHYTDNQLGGSYRVRWDLEYRGGVTSGTETAPAQVVLEYRRISGDTHISLQSGSIVATTTGDPNVTAVEFVCWLNATTTTPETVAGTVSDWYQGVTTVVAALP